jgi:hypothetical protein
MGVGLRIGDSAPMHTAGQPKINVILALERRSARVRT